MPSTPEGHVGEFVGAKRNGDMGDPPILALGKKQEVARRPPVGIDADQG